MKKCFLRALCAILLLCLSGAPALALEFTDANGRSVEVAEHPRRVIALYGSYGDAWLTAGGALVGTTDDMLKEHDPRMSADVQSVGTHTTPNLEALLALEPDFVLLSADVAGQAPGLPLGVVQIVPGIEELEEIHAPEVGHGLHCPAWKGFLLNYLTAPSARPGFLPGRQSGRRPSWPFPALR